ncbi:MAG TPA: chromate efflux transporter [Polyangia bacterium]
MIQATRDTPDARVPLSTIFVAFLRLGLTGFGGPAMVAYIGEMAVKRKGWLSEQSFSDGTAVCQTIPGATAIQTAGYVGLRVRGPVGALAAFVGFGLPAFLLMLVLSVLYQSSLELRPVVSAFRGLHVIVVALVAHATVTFARRRLANGRDVVLAMGAAVFLFLRGNPFVGIAASAAMGPLLHRGIQASASPTRDMDRLWAQRMVRIVLLAALAGGMALITLFTLDRRLFTLAGLMARVDLFAFGGGYASVPMMLHEVVDVRGWMAGKTFMDGIALGQVTPGPIVITATFVGYQVAGLTGAIVGTIAVFTPSFLMVLVTVPYFDRIQHSLLVRRALRAVLASFVGLLLAVTVQFAIAASWTVPAILLSAAAFAALWFKIDVLWVVLVGATMSVFLL